MSTTAMHFGPEWMRTKHQPMARPQLPLPAGTASGPPASAGASTYSALVPPAAPLQPSYQAQAPPLRYSREEMLRIYRETGARGDHLAVEVEMWEGIVRDIATEPVGLKEMDEAEKKLFSTPLNSEIRRRQSTADQTTSLSIQPTGMERPRQGHSSSAISGTPHRDRFGVLMGRRRESDGPSLTIPGRKASGTLPSPRDVGLPSPRSRGFDGVLTGSADGWLARRRASQDMLRQATDDNLEEKKRPDASEAPRNGDKVSDTPSSHRSGPSSAFEQEPSNVDTPDTSQSQTNNLAISISDVALEDTARDPVVDNNVVTEPSPPSEFINATNLASVEWSYLDPQGQIQGPFRADLMEKWYEDGYFAPDLPTKRTKTDTNWITVDELVTMSRGGKPFLTPPFESLPPPGLTRRVESPVNGLRDPATNNSLNQTPFPPAPLADLRTMALDPFLANANNVTDSPSSSFGAGRFGSNSPDAFAGRTSSRGSYTLGDPSLSARTIGYATIPDSSTYPTARPEAFDVDPTFGMSSQVFGSAATGRPSEIFPYNGNYQSNQAAWPTTLNGVVSHPYDTFSDGRAPDSTPFMPNYAPQASIAIPAQPSMTHMHSPLQDSGFGNASGASPFAGAAYTQPAPGEPTMNMPFGSLTQRIPSLQTIAAGLPAVDPFVATSANEPLPHQIPSQSSPSAPSTQVSSPWRSTAEPAEQIPRANPFDPPHPKAINTVTAPSIHIAQPSVWNRNLQSSQSSSQAHDVSPWFAASHKNDDDAWREPAGPNSLTFSNIVQHNQQQQQLAAVNLDARAKLDDDQPTASQPDVQKASQFPEPAGSAVGGSKTRRKSTSPQTQKTAAPPLAPSLPVKNASPPPSVTALPPPKPAWSIDEDPKKHKQSGLSLSLREIQEAEAKKAEARKAAERQQERAAKAAAPAVEDTHPFITSWGLPTSQAGSRNTVAQKEPPVANSPVATATPVWTAATMAPVAKKSMKEIQEEEQRRKKLAVKETAAAAVKRGYSETTTKLPMSAQPPSTQTNNAWTVVGPSGKAAVAAPPTPTRPPVPPSANGAIPSPSVPRPNGNATTKPNAASVAKATTPSTASKVDDYPVNPSHEFLRWLSDSLKGLNNSVNVEDIMQMLLSFPLDPDASTTEIISDLIYTHSTTLDGRRFAAEFVSKRKSDVASRPKGTLNGNVSNKPISIADVVKSQPKPTQPEWGGFKVVNKKKKGGRS